MRFASRVLLGILGFAAATYLTIVGVFFWQLHTITTVSRYPELLQRVHPSLTEHLPKSVPPGATKPRFSFTPGFLQGGTSLQLRVTLPAVELAMEEQRASNLAVHISQGGANRVSLSGEDRSGYRYAPTPWFSTADYEPTPDFPSDYTLYFFTADNRGGAQAWNHGSTSGVAVSRGSSEVVYWAESW